MNNLHPCPAEPRFTLFWNTLLDPDQLASHEAIRSGSTLFSTLIKNTLLTTGMPPVNRIKTGGVWYIKIFSLTMDNFYPSKNGDIFRIAVVVVLFVVSELESQYTPPLPNLGNFRNHILI